MKKEHIAEMFKRLKKHNPAPTTELNYQNPFELLIAVVLSAQATDKGVNKATEKLFPVANTPEKILALNESGLKKYIKTIGLFNSKAKNIIKTCKILVEEHGSQVPQDRASLEAFTTLSIGIMGAAYFLGFTLGCLRGGELVVDRLQDRVPLREAYHRC